MSHKNAKYHFLVSMFLLLYGMSLSAHGQFVDPPSQSDLNEEVSTAAISDSKVVYAQKTIRSKYDSLVQNGLITTVQELPHAMDEDTYVEALRNAFLNQKTDVMSKGMKAPQEDLEQLSQASAIAEDKETFSPIGDLDLSEEDRETLNPLDGFQIDTSQINTLLEEKGQKYTNIVQQSEEAVQSGTLSLKDKTPFWDHTFFDGVGGISGTSEQQVVYISPSVAWQLFNVVALGAGPDIVYNKSEQESFEEVSVGLRTFLKSDIIQQRLFIQAENIWQQTYLSDQNELEPHLYAGAGYIVPLSMRTGLNVSLLYGIDNPSDHELSVHRSPWIFRVGISAFKRNKLKGNHAINDVK